MKEQRPIGWWLKEADARLDAAFDAALAGHGVDRRGWQILASLTARPTSRSELKATLAAFDSELLVDSVIDGLISTGWVVENDGLLQLSAEGADKQAALKPLVDAVRTRVADALPPEDYLALIGLLQRLVDGL